MNSKGDHDAEEAKDSDDERYGYDDLTGGKHDTAMFCLENNIRYLVTIKAPHYQKNKLDYKNWLVKIKDFGDQNGKQYIYNLLLADDKKTQSLNPSTTSGNVNGGSRASLTRRK